MAKIVSSRSVRDAMRKVSREAWHPLIEKTHLPGETQQAVLRQILARHADTTFGRKHAFSRLRTFDEYRRAVPIQDYEDLRLYMEEQDRSRTPVLTIEQPVQYVQTSGTTGKPKYIPICASTKTAIAEYQRIFAYAQCQGVPNIFEGRVLVLSGQSVEGHLLTGTPYGAMSGLLFEGLPWPIRRKDILPSSVRRMTDVNERYWWIAAHALAEPELSVIATPNPSTLLRLLDVIRQCFTQFLIAFESRVGPGEGLGKILPKMSCCRLKRLKSLERCGAGITYAMLWPRLRGVITWTGGNCGALIPRLQMLLPERTALIEMGYLSSEFLGSLNVEVVHNRCVPTIHEHVMEFVPLDEWGQARARALTVDQVEIGEKYHVVVTTPSGLYRYAMNDIVEVTGRLNRTPTIRFVQKGKGVTNITGEKLYEHQVISAVDAVLSRMELPTEFYLMLADVVAQQYVLYVERAGSRSAVAREVDSALSTLNVEFKAKRESGRLNPLVVQPLRKGAGEGYREHCLRKGQRDAQFKLLRLQYRHECSFDFSPYLD